METDTWKIENNICRCCHAEGYFFNLGEPRPFCGETEVYADMIRDIFDIDMQPVPGPVCDLTYTICMSCIFKLREAVQFKKQVQRCEDKFLDYYYTNKLEVSKKKEVQSKAVIKLEPVVEFKEEYLNEDELDSNDDTNPEFEMDDDDDESKSDDDLASLSKKGKGKGKGKSESVLPKTEGAAVKAEQGSAKKKLVKVERIKVPVKKRGVTGDKFTRRQGEDGADEFVCKSCKRVYNNRKNFNQHYHHVHLQKRPKLRSCHLCDVKVSSHKRPFHMETAHGVPVPTCNACGRKFAYPFELLKHQKSYHMGEKKFQCELCDYKCDNKYMFRNHSTVHTGRRDFQCEVCEKSFKRKEHLQVHLAIHLNDRRHVCKICRAAFVQWSSLKYHMNKVHAQ